VKVTYTEETVADIVEAITYLNERNPTVAANLDADITRCVECLAAREVEGPVSTSSVRRIRPELGRAAVPDLLPASS
jgi:hypothetical protein